MIPKKALVILTFILAAGGTFNSPVFADSNPLLEGGINSYQKGNFDEAKNNFSQLLNSPRWSFAALYNLGNIAVRQKHLGEALAYYEKALQKKPRDRDVISNIKFVEDTLGSRHFTGKVTNYELLRENFLNRFTFNEFLAALFVISVIFLGSLLNFLKKRKALKADDVAAAAIPAPTTIITGLLMLILVAVSALKLTDTYNERGIITESKVDLRSGPGETNASMQEVQEGTEVVVLDSSGDWKQVAFLNGGGLAGWIPAGSVMLTTGGGPF